MAAERGPLLAARGQAAKRSTLRRRRFFSVHRAGVAAAIALVLYLGLSLLLWSHVWDSHPTSVATCGCGDPALFMWFLQWPAYAITHGHNPFFSTALFHPGGINLLSNTSVLAIGIPLAPITWLFGPVATLNVASTLAPALSALAAYWVIGRWVPWRPAAFIGGLLYGFSPFVLGNLVYAHLMTATLIIPPLLLACLDELLIRRTSSPVRVGLVLGALSCIEFFLSTEVLVIVVMCTVMGVVFVAAHGWLTDRANFAQRARHVIRGLAAALGLMAVVLAYPVWFALAGPGHLGGAIWPHIPVIGGYTIRAFFDSSYGSSPNLLFDIGGYLGKPLPSSSYMGFGLLAVIVVGLVICRKDRRLWFFSALALGTAIFSLGERKHQWVPWQLFDRIPVLNNVIEQRFIAITYLALAIALAMILGKLRDLVVRNKMFGLTTTPLARVTFPLLTTAVVGAIALVPIAAAFAPDVPFAVQPVRVPTWFATTGKHLPGHQVILAYPAPFSGIQSAMAWQAIDGMDWSQAGGGGPQGTKKRAGKERAGFEVLAALGFGFSGAPSGTPTQLAAVRHALRGWGVTMVVIPEQPGLSVLLRGHDPFYAAAFMTAVLGRVPSVERDAWLWRNVGTVPTALRTTPNTLNACVEAAEAHRGQMASIGPCVVAGAGSAS